MIRINLLPEEYRRKARTPLKVMAAVVAAVATNGLLLAWLGWLSLGVAAEVSSEKNVLQTEVDGLAPQVRYHRDLDQEQKSYAAREGTLANITRNRISWTRKLDELVSLVNSGGDGQRHYVWLNELTVAQVNDPKAKSPGSLKASGFSGSEGFAQVANFLEDVERSPFAIDFMPPAFPEGSVSQVDKELVPSVVWSFPLTMSLKTPDERFKAREAAAQPASKSGGSQAPGGSAPTTPAAQDGQAPAAPPAPAGEAPGEPATAPAVQTPATTAPATNAPTTAPAVQAPTTAPAVQAPATGKESGK